MGTFNLDRFRTEVLSGAGLSRTNRFEVEIYTPRGLRTNYADLASLYVEQASFPPINIFTKQLKIFGPSYQRPITSEYGGEGLTLTFHSDRDMNIKKFLEDWMHIVVDKDNFTVGYQDDYASTIRVKQLDEQDGVTYDIEILEAFPKSMNIVELNNAASNQTQRIIVIFGYRYWRRVTGTEAQDIPISIFKPQVRVPDVRIQPETRKQWSSSGELTYEQGTDLPPAA